MDPRIVSHARMQSYRWTERAIVAFLSLLALWLITRSPNVDLEAPLSVDVSSPSCPAGYADPEALENGMYRCTLIRGDLDQ